MNLEQILAAMRAAHQRMTDLHAKSTAETDAAKKQRLVERFTDEKAEFELLKAKAEELTALDEINAEIERFAAKTAPDATQSGGVSLGAKTSATQGAKTEPPLVSQVDQEYRRAKSTIEIVDDPVKDAMHKRNFFLDYIAKGEKSLGSVAFDAIRSKNERALKINPDAVAVPDYMSSLIRAQVGFGGKSLVDPFHGKVILSTDATGGSTDSGAANLVAPDFRAQLLQKAVAEPAIYDLVQVFQAVNGSAEWPMLDQDQGDYGGMVFTYKSTEGADKGETEPVLTNFTISTNELSGWTEVSNTALRRSAISLEGMIIDLMRRSCRAQWSKDIVIGNGINKPMGLLNDTGVTVVPRAVTNQVGWADLTNLEYGVSMASRANGRFLMHDGVEGYLKRQVDTDKRPVFTADVLSNMRNLLAGYNYLTHLYAGTTLGTEGDVIFGNLFNYGFALEEDMAIAKSEHAEFKKGRIVYRLMCFIGGKAIYPALFTRLGDPTT